MRKILKNYKIIILIIAVILLAVSFLIYIYYDNNNEEEIYFLENDVEEVKENKIDEKENDKKIAIHITGEVKKPGMIYLSEGSRIADAIEKAGGVTLDADVNKVNLAYILEDGQKIYIPSKKDVESKEYIISDSGNNVLIENSSSKTSVKGVRKKVNINLANQEDLEGLPGIGELLATRIIEYRNENGKFKSIEDIKNVKGIGDNKYNDIKSNICIE